jgi:hypothetical protein
MRDCSWVPKSFENLAKAGFDPIRDCTSDSTDGLPVTYNCIAWAAGRKNEWWWPIEEAGYTWPDGLSKDQETIENFVNAFKLQGYKQCKNGSFEPGYEKVAIFANSKMEPLHAARSLETGKWTSKLGAHEDIEHPSLASIEGKEYGKAVEYLKRRNPNWKRPNLLARLLFFLSRPT